MWPAAQSRARTEARPWDIERNVLQERISRLAGRRLACGRRDTAAQAGDGAAAPGGGADRPTARAMPRHAPLPVALLLLTLAPLLTLAAATTALQLSSDGGRTWPSTATATAPAALPAPSAAAAALPLHARAAHRAHARAPRAACAPAAVAWVDAAGAPPFALGWRPAGPHAACGEGGRVRVVESVVPALRPRWAPFRRVEGAADAADAAGKAAAERPASSWARWRRQVGGWQGAALPLALFAIVALGHGIYLGIAAVEADEAAELCVREEAEAAAPA
jgi:hypothetical protein